MSSCMEPTGICRRAKAPDLLEDSGGGVVVRTVLGDDHRSVERWETNLDVHTSEAFDLLDVQVQVLRNHVQQVECSELEGKSGCKLGRDWSVKGKDRIKAGVGTRSQCLGLRRGEDDASPKMKGCDYATTLRQQAR